MRVARSPPSRESSVCKEIPFLHESLLRGLLLNGALHLGGSRARLHAHDTAAPGALDLLAVLVVLLADGSHELAELVPILRADGDHREAAGGLLVNQLSKARLALHDAIRNVHLAAKGWQPDDELNWVDVVRNDNELRLLLLAKLANVVEAELDVDLLLLGLVLLSLLLLLCESLQTLLLLALILGPVLVQQLEQVDGDVLVNGVRELVDRRRYL
mmetsp:Transcript_5194/g.11283  ORF Transcript_5194/g.11283 Transcript_5194/m.11283 type:complete len:215 (+) Transcript_5194:336-980(+)